jgi:hypothetical protein
MRLWFLGDESVKYFGRLQLGAISNYPSQIIKYEATPYSDNFGDNVQLLVFW